MSFSKPGTREAFAGVLESGRQRGWGRRGAPDEAPCASGPCTHDPLSPHNKSPKQSLYNRILQMRKLSRAPEVGGGRLSAQGPGRGVFPPPLSPPLSQLRSRSLGCVMVPLTPRARGSFSRFLPELAPSRASSHPQPSPHAPVRPAGPRAAGFLPGRAQPQVQDHLGSSQKHFHP